MLLRYLTIKIKGGSLLFLLMIKSEKLLINNYRLIDYIFILVIV